MTYHEELRMKLNEIGEMDRRDASKIVTEVLKYIMDTIKEIKKDK